MRGKLQLRARRRDGQLGLGAKLGTVRPADHPGRADHGDVHVRRAHPALLRALVGHARTVSRAGWARGR